MRTTQRIGNCIHPYIRRVDNYFFIKDLALYTQSTYSNIMNEIEKVWLACAIDGEGGIDFREYTENNRQFRVSVNNTNKDFAKRAKHLLNGKIMVQEGKLTELGNKRKPKWVAYVDRKDEVKNILEEILPYLIIKQKKAKDIIDWINKHPTMTPKDAAMHLWNNFSEEEKTEKMKKLKRGHKKYWEKKRQQEAAYAIS